jgi:hypothetical protein
VNSTSIHPLWALCLIASGLGCTSSGNKQAAANPPGETRIINFVDAKRGVKLVYTSDWSETSFFKPPQMVVLLVRGDEVLSLASQPPAKPLSPSDLPVIDQQTIDKLPSQFDDFKLVERNDTTLGGEPAKRTVYTGKKFGRLIESMNVLCIHGGSPYLFVYMSEADAFTDGRPGVQKIIDSVEFTK